jgi:hypothetical protein
VSVTFQTGLRFQQVTFVRHGHHDEHFDNQLVPYERW